MLTDDKILSDDEHTDLVRGAGLVCTAGWPINDLIRYGRAVERAVVDSLPPELRAMSAAAPPAPGCIDPLCPCQDGALCHYVDGPDGTMALPAPSAEPTVPAAFVNWLLEQCEEYQRRAHDAEREVQAMRAQIEQIGGGR
jgi:hypothetical protein